MNYKQRSRLVQTNNTFFSNVVKATSNYLGGRQLLPNERNELSNYIRQIDLRKINNRKIAVDKVAKGFSARIIRSNQVIDTHEIMKKEINTINTREKTMYNLDCGPVYPRDSKTRYIRQSVNQRDGQNNTLGFGGIPESIERPMRLENVASPFNSAIHKYPNTAKQMFQSAYLLLDSKYRNLTTDDSTFKWTVVNSQNTTQGTVNTICDQIHNITSIQFEEFNIPTYTETNIYGKVSLYIKELSSMSTLMNNGGRYHMLFDSVDDGLSRKSLVPAIYNDGEFKFHTPINTLDTITITFRNPFRPMTFYPDYLTVLSVSKASPAVVSFSTANHLETGDYVEFTGFTTTTPDHANDAPVIAEINRETGHKITVTAPTTFTIAVDTSSVNGTITGGKIYIQSRRIFIPLRLEYIV